MADGTAEVKQEKGEHLNLKIVGQDGSEVFFKIKKVTRLGKMFDAFCQRQGVERNAVRFLFEGNRVNAEQTPDELHMEDGDAIDAMVEQTGGMS